ncbi:MAG: conserved phage C-terminal domain-containing protein [Clostridia bacterium]|nr:conserved phage C-terminal domain-containing protein [Clostridia bacterium]
MKYFKVYMDFIDTIGALGDAERGRLFTAMLEYARTGTEPELGGNERYIWGAVKSALDKQRSAYENVCSINKRIATERNGASRTVTKRNGASHEREASPHTPLKEKDIYISPSSGNGIDSLTEDCNEVIDFLNQVAGTQYKHSETSRKPIRARLNEGFTVEDCKQVIRNRWKAWRGTEWQQYMRPDTLFRPSKFEGYLNAGETAQPGRYDNLKRLMEETPDE